MAKEKHIDEDDKLKKDQDKARLAQAEEEELKKKEAEALLKRKEKEKKQKIRDQRQKKREEKEKKRIRRIIDFPFMVVRNISAVLSITYFMIQFFGKSEELLQALFSSFLVFLVCFLGGCLVVFAFFFALSQKKEKELMEQIRHNEEQIKMEEERKRKEEQELLETQKVMLETNDDNLEAKRQEELKKFREMKENESKLRPSYERQSKAALDIEDQLSRLPDEFLEPDEGMRAPEENGIPAENGFPNFNLNFNPDEDLDNPFITMPKK